MSYIVTNLTTGVNYKIDVVKSFQDAIADPTNFYTDGSVNWNFVSADMHMDLSTWYAASYIDEAMEYMADLYDEDRVVEIKMLEYV
jgi:hypothetical protein